MVPPPLPRRAPSRVKVQAPPPIRLFLSLPHRSGHPPVDALPRLALASAPNTPGLDPESIPSPPFSATPQVAPTGSPPSAGNVPEDPEFLRRRKRGWAKLIAKTFKDDPGICKGCGHPMLRAPSLVALSHRRHWPRPARCHRARPAPRQSLALRSFRCAKRLRARPSPPTTLRAVPGGSGHFAARPLAAQPPWLRMRRARGPPPTARGTAVPTNHRSPADAHQDIDPVIDDALYCVDEIPDDDR